MALLCFLPGNSPASFAAEITTPYLGSYSSITTFTPELLIESIKEPVLPYSGKGYITIDDLGSGELPRRKHTTYRTRRKFEIMDGTYQLKV